MGLQTALLFPLHLGVLLILHSIFAFVRLVHVVSQLSPQISRHQSTSSSPSLDLARKRWSKVPKHLAVVLAPVQWRAGSQGDVEAKKEQLIKLMEWCKELGIPQLSVYDRDGILVSNAESIATLNPMQSMLVKNSPDGSPIITFVPSMSATPPRPDQIVNLLDQDQLETASSDETGSTTLVSDGTSTPKSSPSFTLRLLSRQAGRPQLAKLAQELAISRSNKSRLSPLTSEKVAEAIDSFPLPEPDLVFVFGGSYLRLSGFPPWQIRLSEMYHYPSPAWLPSPTLTYPIFRKAVDLYGRAEMRLGR
ncbi:hypothetical protein JCM5353_006728 [Sporobolomyces roseus]